MPQSLPTFSGPTVLQDLEDFQVIFEQICMDNDIPKSSWACYSTPKWTES